MWFKNLLIYRLNNWEMQAEALEDALASLSLQPLSGLELHTKGWVPVKADGAAYVHGLGQQLLFAFGSEKKLLPSSVINQVAKQRAQEMEERDGFKPGRKRLKELKEEITDELLPRAFAIRSKTLVWVDAEQGLLCIDAASASKADDIVALLIRTVPGLSLSLLKTKLSPVLAMTTWLGEDEAPNGFSIDRDCELKGRGEEGATVRYVKHPLDAQEIRAHIESGKEVTKLAMTWDDRLSFVLTEALQIKRLIPLDILKENAENAGYAGDDDAFNADFGLMTTELRRFLPALIDALGSELNHLAD